MALVDLFVRGVLSLLVNQKKDPAADVLVGVSRNIKVNLWFSDDFR